MSPIIYRTASLIEEYWKEQTVFDEPFNKLHCLDFLQTFVEDGDYLGYVEKEGELLGIVLATKAPVFWNYQSMIVDNLLTYVPKKNRGTWVGIKLIKGMIDWAKSVNATKITISTTSGINSERTSKLYEKLGFKNMGAACVMQLREE